MKMVYADSTLLRMTKKELIEEIRCLEHNLRGAEETSNRQCFYLKEICDTHGIPSEELEALQEKYIRSGK